MSKKALQAVLTAATFLILLLTSISETGPASAKEVEQEEEIHCVAVAVADAEKAQAEPVCFATEAAADQLVAQLTNDVSYGTRAGSGTHRAGGSNTIGRHYKNKWYGGSSITVVGTTCSGGVWKPTGSWNNNIESSKHYCGGSPTRFYDSSGCSGGNRAIYGATGSLGSYNNKASCVRYG